VRSLAVDDQTARVMAALESSGIAALLLKGPVVARRLYAKHEQRFYGDTDVLVSPAEVVAAGRTLCALGYEQVGGRCTTSMRSARG